MLIFISKTYPVTYLEDLTGEIRSGTFVTPIRNMLSGCRQSYSGVLLFINGMTMAIFFASSSNKCYLFDSHSRDQFGQVCSAGSSVLITFASVLGFQNYILDLYYDSFNQDSIYFQLYPVSVCFPAGAKETIYQILRHN